MPCKSTDRPQHARCGRCGRYFAEFFVRGLGDPEHVPPELLFTEEPVSAIIITRGGKEEVS